MVNNDVNKIFNKNNSLIFDEQIITKQDNKIFKTNITPELLTNAEPIHEGFNITKENGIVIYNNNGIKQLNIDEIPNSLSLEQEAIFFKTSPINTSIVNLINNNNPSKNIDNILNKDFILIKSTEDSSLRLINQNNLSEFGQESDFKEPILINNDGKKGVIFKTPNNNDIRFLPLNNIIQNSEKVINSIILKVNNQDNLLMPDKDGIKLFNISDNLDKADIVNNKLKVKIDGKTFFIIPENKMGEHLVIPESPSLNKHKHDLSSPLKIQIDKEEFILFKNPETKNLQMIPENKANKLSKTIDIPVQANLNGVDFLFSNVDKKVYKLPLNNKAVDNSKPINEPIQLNNSDFIIFDKSNKANVFTLDKKQLFKADKITENTTLKNESGSFLLTPSKDSKILSLNNIDRLAKFTTDLKPNNILINNNDGTFILNKNHLDKNKVEVKEPILLKKDDKEYLFVQGKKSSTFINKENVIKNSSILDNILIPDKNNSTFITKDNSGIIKNIIIPNKLINNPEKVRELIQAKIGNQNIVITPDKEKLNISLLKPEDKIDTSKNYNVTIDDKNYTLFFNKNKPSLINNNITNSLESHDFSKPIKVNIDNSEYIIFKSPEDNKIKILPTDKINLQNIENFDVEKIVDFEVSDFINSKINEKTNTSNIFMSKEINNITPKDYKLSLSINDGELILRKITKQNQNDINIDHINNNSIENFSNETIEINDIANNGLFINQLINTSKSIKEPNEKINLQEHKIYQNQLIMIIR
jgi:hypothetical protein